MLNQFILVGTVVSVDTLINNISITIQNANDVISVMVPSDFQGLEYLTPKRFIAVKGNMKQDFGKITLHIDKLSIID